LSNSVPGHHYLKETEVTFLFTWQSFPLTATASMDTNMSAVHVNSTTTWLDQVAAAAYITAVSNYIYWIT